MLIQFEKLELVQCVHTLTQNISNAYDSRPFVKEKVVKSQITTETECDEACLQTYFYVSLNYLRKNMLKNSLFNVDGQYKNLERL